MGIFDRIVVGIDGSDFGLEACHQALALLAPGGTLVAVTALDEARAAQAGFLASRSAAELRADADAARGRAEDVLREHASCSTRLVRGDPVAALLSVCREEEATLVAVGGRHRSRIAGLLLSGVSTVVMHDAPCSVLLAHPRWGERWSPERVLVGVDGSPQSLVALGVADELAARFASALTVASATHGKPLVPDDAWSARVHKWNAADPVVALVDESVFADLVVVGSRGLHGIRALGSVSERVAHRAHCSTLVVRSSPALGGDTETS